jgi:hypothetical protein
MPSDHSQVLDLLASGQIDFYQTERLLCLISTRDRFITLTVWIALLAAAAWNQIPQIRLGNVP